MENDSTPTIYDLNPGLSGGELEQAEEVLEQYIALVLRIYERLSADPAGYTHLRALLGTGGTLQSCTPRKEPPGLLPSP